MKQRIYISTTKFEGIEAPAEQEYNVTVDEDGKLKSEAKPTIPAQFNPIEGSNITITGTYPNMTFSASGTVGTNWDDIGGDQSDIDISGFTNDSGFITEVTEGDVTQYESALTITESQISDLGDYLESGDNISELTNDSGYTTNTGTVTSVEVSVPTGLEVSGSPVTTSGTIGITYASGYQGYTSTEASKLTGIEAGAEVNVNADWDAVSGDAQILNKPSIPTKTSDLANDSGFVTSSGVTSVSGTANQIDSTGGDTPTLSLHNTILDSIELANSAIQSGDLATVATTGDYNDLDNLPSIPAQLNPTAGTGISITGTYPNLTVTNTAPNVAQGLKGILSVDDTSDIKATFGDDGVTMDILGDGSGFRFDDGKSFQVIKPDLLLDDNIQKFQDKSGDIAVITDISDYFSTAITPYATQNYVRNYNPGVVFLDDSSPQNSSLDYDKFGITHIFKGTENKLFKIVPPDSVGVEVGTRFHIINADATYSVTIEKWTVGEPDFIDLSNNNTSLTMSIPPLSAIEVVGDGTDWFYTIK